MNRMRLAENHTELGARWTRRLAAENFARDTARDSETALANARATSSP